MARVRALYEGSGVPVREIARLVGVTERTLYKYAEKGGWRRRYIARPRGAAAAKGNRGRRWQRAAGHDGVKGAGGRFIARAEAGRPVVRGLQALDPSARAQAAEAAAAAAALEAQARADDEYIESLEVRAKALFESINAVEALVKFQDERKERQTRYVPPAVEAADTEVERVLSWRVDNELLWLDSLKRAAPPRTDFAPDRLVSPPPMRE